MVLSRKQATFDYTSCSSGINHLFLPNQLCLPPALHIKPSSSPKQLCSTKGKSQSKGICYRKCLLVASSTMPPPKLLTAHCKNSPPLLLPHKTVQAVSLNAPLKQNLVFIWQEGNRIVHAWHTATVGINPEAATFCRK